MPRTVRLEYSIESRCGQADRRWLFRKGYSQLSTTISNESPASRNFNHLEAWKTYGINSRWRRIKLCHVFLRSLVTNPSLGSEFLFSQTSFLACAAFVSIYSVLQHTCMLTGAQSCSAISGDILFHKSLWYTATEIRLLSKECPPFQRPGTKKRSWGVETIFAPCIINGFCSDALMSDLNSNSGLDYIASSQHECRWRSPSIYTCPCNGFSHSLYPRNGTTSCGQKNPKDTI